MARAETIENVGETGSGGNSCRMELPRPFQTWPGLLTTTPVTTRGSGAMQPHHLHHPLQAIYLPYPLPYPHLEGQDEPQTHQQFPALSPSPTPSSSSSSSLPPCNQKEETGCAPSAFSGEQSADLGAEESVDAASRRLGPLPDLLPQNEHRLMDNREEAAQELEVRRVAHQLRMIGDEYNATVLRRAHAAPHWQDWRDTFRGLLNFITQSLSTLYRLT